MAEHSPFKWRHFQADLILLCVRWYLRYALSYRDLEEIMLERGLSVDHTTIFRWVQPYAPELERRCRPHVKPTTDSWRVDETYIKVKKEWVYLYRAVDSHGQTLDFFAHIDQRRESRQAVLAQNPHRLSYQRATSDERRQKRCLSQSVRHIESGRRLIHNFGESKIAELTIDP